MTSSSLICLNKRSIADGRMGYCLISIHLCKNHLRLMPQEQGRCFLSTLLQAFSEIAPHTTREYSNGMALRGEVGFASRMRNGVHSKIGCLALGHRHCDYPVPESKHSTAVRSIYKHGPPGKVDSCRWRRGIYGAVTQNSRLQLRPPPYKNNRRP